MHISERLFSAPQILCAPSVASSWVKRSDMLLGELNASPGKTVGLGEGHGAQEW